MVSGGHKPREWLVRRVPPLRRLRQTQTVLSRQESGLCLAYRGLACSAPLLAGREGRSVVLLQTARIERERNVISMIVKLRPITRRSLISARLERAWRRRHPWASHAGPKCLACWAWDPIAPPLRPSELVTPSRNCFNPPAPHPAYLHEP